LATPFQLPPTLSRIAAHLEVPLQCEGDVSLLECPRRALLVSRTEKKIAPDAPWLLALRHAVDELFRAAETLVSGTGRVPYELPLWLAARSQRCGAIIVLTREAERSALDAGLLPARRLLVWPDRTLKNATALALRDRLIGALADRATAIHVRKGGAMQVLAAEISARGGRVDPAPEIALPTPAGKRPQTNLIATQSTGAWNYLSHFTREPDGMFPGESREQYFEWLCRGAGAPPRDAFASLCRILSEQRIRASTRLMPQRAAMACFTALPPAQALELRRWRRGLRRWSFTPCGIAIRSDALTRIGAQRVRYLKQDEAAPDAGPTFLQTYGTGELDWSREQEWRVPGDVALSQFPRDEILILTATASEAAQITQRFGYAASALYL